MNDVLSIFKQSNIGLFGFFVCEIPLEKQNLFLTLGFSLFYILSLHRLHKERVVYTNVNIFAKRHTNYLIT